MTKVHKVELVDFEDRFILLRVDGRDYRADLRSQSQKLASADEITRKHFTISPSGYGIHWPDLDEDLSIDGIIKAALKVS